MVEFAIVVSLIFGLTFWLGWCAGRAVEARKRRLKLIEAMRKAGNRSPFPTPNV